MLGCLLRGKTGQSEILKAFADKNGEAQVEKQLTKIDNLSTTVRRFWLFRPLFEHYHAITKIHIALTRCQMHHGMKKG
jgi:hypothetical protein